MDLRHRHRHRPLPHRHHQHCQQFHAHRHLHHRSMVIINYQPFNVCQNQQPEYKLWMMKMNIIVKQC